MKKHLLIVDDEVSNLELLREVFDGLADQISLATNGEDAFAIVQESGDINCILSDINMPVCDGFSFLTKLKSSNSEIPFIFLTGFADQKNIEKAKKLGATDLVDKNEWDRVIDIVNSIYSSNGSSLL